MRTEFATPVSSIASRAVRVLDASRVADALNRRLEEQDERGSRSGLGFRPGKQRRLPQFDFAGSSDLSEVLRTRRSVIFVTVRDYCGTNLAKD